MAEARASKPNPGQGSDVGPGLYPFLNMGGDAPTRFHLRVDPDGGGILLANASEAAHLSPVGVAMAHRILSGVDDETGIQQIRKAFWGSAEAQVRGDWEAVRALIGDLASPDARYPVTDFGAAAEGTDGRRLAAPYRADLTQGAPEALEPILRKLWDLTVPQVTFLARPDRDPKELVRLVEIAEDIGMIAGLRSVASWLSHDVLRDIAFAGLDYLALPFASCDPAEHNLMVGAEGDFGMVRAAWDLCREWELCPVAQVPLTDETMDELEELIECVADCGVSDMWFFAVACLDDDERADTAGALPARYLPQVAAAVYEDSEQFGYRFVWQPPVRFRPGQSLPEHVIAGPRTSGDVSVRVEPDGSVYPPRGSRSCAGNLLSQPWASIWGGDCFTRFREVVPPAAPSRICPDLPICQIWPPEDPASWSDDTRESGA